MIFAQHIKFAVVSLALGAIANLLPFRATAAEKITLNFPPFGHFYIQVEDLEKFVATGEVSQELAYYLNRLPSEQVDKLPELLSTPLEANPLSIAKFSNSTIGAATIENFGKVVRADVNLNGFYALRGAIIAAAFDKQGLTVMNLLHHFPLDNVYLDLPVLNQYVRQGAKLLENRDAIARHFFTMNKLAVDKPTRVGKLKSLQLSGSLSWDKSTFTYHNPHRSQQGYFDLYQPQVAQPVPLVVISHGLASNRETFAYLAQHFASNGLAVAVIEHGAISFNRFDRFLSGESRFPEPNNLIDQPLDVQHVLDKLELEATKNPQLQNRLNFSQVGVIGQSFGGYTALALAGGELNADFAAKECQPESYHNVLLDLSSLAKCTYNKLDDRHYQLKDPRIKAAIAINPLGKMFGKSGMGSIEIPSMLISGTHDLITPPIVEQVKPFTWLNEDIDKYLVLVKSGTHFSFLQEGLGVLPVPDNIVGANPSSGYPALKVLSTAFFKVHLAEQAEYQKYLQSDHVNLLSNSSFQFSLLRSLTKDELQSIIDN